jgi:hypothetical protein
VYSPPWPEPEPVLLEKGSARLENLSGTSCLAVRKGRRELKALSFSPCLFLKYKIQNMNVTNKPAARSARSAEGPGNPPDLPLSWQ